MNAIKNAAVSLLAVSCATVLSAAALERTLAESVLGKDDRYASWTSFYRQLHECDANADKAWDGVATVSEFDAMRASQRAKMLKRIGGFPERTPLNAKVAGVVKRDGYRIEKILFESRPGMYVTGNLYLPDESRFPAPYPAAIEVCGHSAEGKNAPKYQRAALLCAKNGVAALVIDPVGQGERCQSIEETLPQKGTPVGNHLRMGVNAVLMGRGLAAFEIWDAIRALDYLDTRADIRKGGYGSFGNSGGGTQSVMLSALDGRIKATATSCYLSNLRDQTMWRLLADSEQLVFGQLADGINHASYALLGSNPVLMLARRDDIIPFSGTLDTARLLGDVSRKLKREGRYSFVDSPGPHGYNETLMRATAVFMARQLRGAEAVFDEPEFDVSKQDFGPDKEELLVAPGGSVQSIGGFKSVYSHLQDELDAVLASRVYLAKEALAEKVRAVADIDERRVGARTVVLESYLEDATRVTRVFYEILDGYRMPVVELVPKGAETAAPLIVAVDGPRTNCAAIIRANSGRPVFVPDLCACGETGTARHHYACRHDDEETAKMLYLLGSSLVGRRAGELIALGKEAKRRFGKNPDIIAQGRLAVPAAHAIAAAPGIFVRHEFVDPPISWTKAVRSRAMSLYSTSVNGGLLHYDWVDLTAEKPK